MPAPSPFRGQVLSTVPVMFSYWAKDEHCADLSRIINDGIADVVSTAPNRFVGMTLYQWATQCTCDSRHC